ncbi:hypothetical protein C439_09490 [Haloferax mediterranei ATCC 33500]|uniref:Uncharacterized protein n=2 Tax=Haloferacaceae TaxID=1644056 RepID=M0J4Y7_HALMT|nr:hypothetical protein C439_09490 [Haloferax mediterranei ATCC 33500]
MEFDSTQAILFVLAGVGFIGGIIVYLIDILPALKREDSSVGGSGYADSTEATCGFVRTSLGLS